MHPDGRADDVAVAESDGGPVKYRGYAAICSSQQALASVYPTKIRKSRPMHSLLLIAHGSRRAEANADLDYLAEQMRTRDRFPLIGTAYLELAEPNIAHGGASLVERGATTVTMLPYFLSPGVHVREDLIEARAELATRFPAVEFRLAPHLGRHPLMAEIVEQRAQQIEESVTLPTTTEG